MLAVTADDAIRLLNEALALDAKATEELVSARVACSEALAEHPTIQCGVNPDGSCRVGILGILNGIFGLDGVGNGYIAAQYDGERLVGFARFASKGGD